MSQLPLDVTVVTPAPIPDSSPDDPGSNIQGQPSLRKCPPYWHANKTFAKGRWLNREILEMISTEFRDRSVEYYRFALSSGVTRVNDKVVFPGYIIQNGDIIENMRHRHEPPITSTPVKIIHRDDQNGFIVVDKPGSIPVHAAGRYYKHSLTEILISDFGIEKPYTVNRLDRLTSGCMFIATTAATARLLTEEMIAGVVRKEYVARCIGSFPEEEVIVEEPMLCIDRQMGLNIVHPEGKPAKTIFNRLFYDEKSDTSVLHCQPLTGRSHQIRVHLQFIGHPIANDPVYSDPKVWGPLRGMGGLPIEAEEKRKSSPHSSLAAEKEKEAPEPSNSATTAPGLVPPLSPQGTPDERTDPSSTPKPALAVIEELPYLSPTTTTETAIPSTAEPSNTDPIYRFPSPDLYPTDSPPSHNKKRGLRGPKKPKSERTPHLPPRFKTPPSKPFTSATRGGVTNLMTPTSMTTTDEQPLLPHEGGMLPRESGDDIGQAAPVALSPETVAVISALRNQKDETEEFSRWRDVIFRTKAALKIHGPSSVHENERSLVPIHVRQQREEARRTAHQSHSLNDEAATELSTSSAAPSQNNSNPYLTNEGQLHFARRGSPSPGRKSQDNGDGAAEDDSDAPAFPYCEECFVPLYPDPKPSQLYIYLHALRYTTTKWSFATEMPFWAQKGWVPDEQ